MTEKIIPDGHKLVAVKGLDELVYWLERCKDKGHLENCADLIEPFEAFEYRNVSEEAVIAAHKAKAAPAVPDTDELESALERLVERCNTDQFLCNDDAVIHAEATLERIYKSRKSTATPAAPSQPVTLTDEYVASHLEAAGVKFQRFKGGISGTKDCWSTSGSQDVRKLANGVRAIIAALRKKEQTK